MYLNDYIKFEKYLIKTKIHEFNIIGSWLCLIMMDINKKVGLLEIIIKYNLSMTCWSRLTLFDTVSLSDLQQTNSDHQTDTTLC